MGGIIVHLGKKNEQQCNRLFSKKSRGEYSEPILTSRISEPKKLVICLLTSTCQELLNILVKYFRGENA